MLAGTTAAGVSAALVFGHAIDNTADTPQVKLAAAVIGIGGRGDPTSANIPNKLRGTVVPPGVTYIPVQYPASYFIDQSTAAGVPVLNADLMTYRLNNPGSPVEVVGYSEGTIVAEDERRNLANSNIPQNQLSFLMIASPNVPNGGIFARFPTLNLLIVSSNGPAQPSKYNTTYVTNEYDPYADFPAYFNPISLANSLVAVEYVHPDKYYDAANLNAPGVEKTVVTNSAGGTDTYYFIPAQHLPLLQPARDVSSALGITPLTEPVISGVEPVLVVLVDMGYTDRQNLDPEAPTQFSLITPPAKIGEALAAMPGAIQQGENNFLTGVSPAGTAWTPLSSPVFSSASAPQHQSVLGPTNLVADAAPVLQTPPASTNPPADPLPLTPPPSNPLTGALTNAVTNLSPFAIADKLAPNGTPGTTTLGSGPANTTNSPGGNLVNSVTGAVSSTVTGVTGAVGGALGGLRSAMSGDGQHNH
jgi:diacyltrehalose acyltransferase